MSSVARRIKIQTRFSAWRLVKVLCEEESLKARLAQVEMIVNMKCLTIVCQRQKAGRSSAASKDRKITGAKLQKIAR
jgi:hypothetical protein